MYLHIFTINCCNYNVRCIPRTPYTYLYYNSCISKSLCKTVIVNSAFQSTYYGGTYFLSLVTYLDSTWGSKNWVCEMLLHYLTLLGWLRKSCEDHYVLHRRPSALSELSHLEHSNFLLKKCGKGKQRVFSGRYFDSLLLKSTRCVIMSSENLKFVM